MQATLISKKGDADADVDYRIETIAKLLARRDNVPRNLHVRIAREWFMPRHGDYYLDYIVVRRRDIDKLAVSPHYVVVSIRPRRGSTNFKTYVIGIDYDSDMLFVNRVHYIDLYGLKTDKIDRIVDNRGDVLIIYTDDDAIKENAFTYHHDVVTDEYVVQLPPTPVGIFGDRYRVQGDLVFVLNHFSLRDNIFAWSMSEIRRYINYLATDKIAAILMDHGLSVDVERADNIRYALILRGGTNSSRWSRYSSRNRLRIAKLLGEYFDISADQSSTFTAVDIKDENMQARVEIVSRAYFGSDIGDIRIIVRDVENPQLFDTILNDMVEQFKLLKPIDVTRYVGNHRIELKHVIPVTFSYNPRILPLVLEPLTLYISAQHVYVVDTDSIATLMHREHGIRKIKFADRYVLSIEHVTTHRDETAERNRTILKRIKPYKT
jgi:hypothetical protein